MATTQKDRILSIKTPLEEDFLLLNTLSLTEGISQLFTCEVQLLHEESKEGFEATDVDITSILGKGVKIEIAQKDGSNRILTGIVNAFSKGGRNQRFSFYQATIVPHVWLLTQNIQSRIFQQKSVQEILETVLAGFEFSVEIEGNFKPRNYCVQYNESDWDFISRLMEEEGFYYYFDFTDAKHKLIIANTPKSHNECPGKSKIPYSTEATSEEDFVSVIRDLQTDYKLQSGKVARRDYSFQLPTNKLEGDQLTLHTVGDNQKLEIYDYPAGYAVKYDGIDRMGGENSGNLNNVFPDKQRTIENAMQVLDAQYMVLNGFSDCVSMIAGHRFELINHPTKDKNGDYVITAISHTAEQSPGYITDEEVAEPYTNSFSCIPQKTPYRPLRKTPKPVMKGNQTAVVVGPSGEEIFTDKYGRVKVQFPWDREGVVDESSSCWIRVGQGWAGNRWGMMFIPRIGMEVIIDFLEGNPDDPIITGCVYNPETMPPYILPDEKTKMTIKSDSSKGGKGFNEIRFEDLKGKEQVFIHAQKDFDMRVRNDRRELIGNDRHLIVNRDKRERIKRDEHNIIERDSYNLVKRDYHFKVEKNVMKEIAGELSETVTGKIEKKYSDDYSVAITGKESVSAREIVFEADTKLTIKVGGNFINIHPGGIDIVGTMVKINSGGAAGTATHGSPVKPAASEEAMIADNADPGSKSPTYKNQIKKQSKFEKLQFGSSPSHKPNSKTNEEKKSWIEIRLEDEEGNPVAGEKYLVTLPDGQTIDSGTLDSEGYAKVTNIDPGNCKITFPNLDGRSWNKK